jgi:hypothetical protein
MHASKWTYFFAGALVALISVAVTRALDAKPARKAGSNVMLAPEDYIEIEQLYGMYARDNDPGSLRDASWMFTKDGVWCSVSTTKRCELVGSMTGPFFGTAELKQFFTRIRERQTNGVRHFNSSYVIVGTPDGGARGSVYMVTVQQRGKDGHPEIFNFGKYEDKLVKTPEGWRIKERLFRADSYVGSDLPIEPSPIPGDDRTADTGLPSKPAAKN